MSAEHNPDGTAEVQAATEGAKLLLAVREWIEQDPDQNDRDELRGLLEQAQDPSAPEDHLMPVVAMPWMKWRWKKRKTTRIGSTMSVAPASSSP